AGRLVEADRLGLADAGLEADPPVAERDRLGLQRRQQRPADPRPRASGTTYMRLISASPGRPSRSGRSAPQPTGRPSRRATRKTPWGGDTWSAVTSCSPLSSGFPSPGSTSAA